MEECEKGDCAVEGGGWEGEGGHVGGEEVYVWILGGLVVEGDFGFGEGDLGG